MIKEYVENLKRTNGLEKARKIAGRCMKHTNPNTWQDLPIGSVFFPTDKKGNKGQAERHLKKLYNFWVHVFHLLKKEK